MKKISKHTHKIIIKTVNLIYTTFISTLILGLFIFLKSMEKETVLLLGEIEERWVISLIKKNRKKISVQLKINVILEKHNNQLSC